VNLDYFNADFNALQTVNLSNLPNLTYVDVSDCDFPGTGTSSLTSINLSGSPIIALRLDDSDFSAGITVNTLPYLNWLDLDQCNLPSLDVSGLNNLFFVDAWGNDNMTTIDITGCSNLVELYLDSCALTQQSVDHILAELDDQGNTSGYLDISDTGNAYPSPAGMVSLANLVGKGWTIFYNAPPTTTTTTAVPTTTTTTI
jgi:Leucine-rich repeat (LRR) protein